MSITDVFFQSKARSLCIDAFSLAIEAGFNGLMIWFVPGLKILSYPVDLCPSLFY